MAPSRTFQNENGPPVAGTAASSSASPFREANSLDKRFKLFLWGDTGVGKTTLALQFPSPVLIDLEGGADLYGDSFDFDVLRASTADEVMNAVRWLRTNQHSYRTLILDPVTVYWESLQKKWSEIFLRRNKSSKGYKFEFYDFQPRDWMTIKAEFKQLVRTLVALDMNVVVTARQKLQYADGSFMQAIGETFDCERSVPYLFDTIIRLHRDEKGRFRGECQKDRSKKLPQGDFDCSFKHIEQLFGRDELNREPIPTSLATDAQRTLIAKCIEQLGLPEEHVAIRLAELGASSLAELTQETAQAVLEKLEAACSSKSQTSPFKE